MSKTEKLNNGDNEMNMFNKNENENVIRPKIDLQV
jgi:hypothetical protein